MKRLSARWLPLFLLAQLGMYMLLPFFGAAWHNLAPEHEHVYLGAVQADEAGSTVGAEINAAAVSAARIGLGLGERVIHAFNPAATLQVFAIVLGFSALSLLLVPPGFSQRVAITPLFRRFPPQLPLDPPPVA